MATLLHHSLPKGSQLELLNVIAQVARRDNDDPESDYVLCFEDHRENVKVYVPMDKRSYREWIEAQYRLLSKIEIADKLPAANGHATRGGLIL